MQTGRSLSMDRWIGDTQLAWAGRAGLDVDASGAVADPAEHLMVRLSEETRRALAGSLHALLGEEGKRGPLHGLDSTHALLCHLVEPLRGAGERGLESALGARSAGGSVRVCAPLGEASGGEVGLEAELVIDAAHPTIVLARYREPWSAPDRRPPSPPDAPAHAWTDLPGCRSLARDLRANPARYRWLEVGRLLETVRRLTRRFGPRGFRLVHVWFDGPGPEARQYAREIARLRMRVGGDVELDAIGWRALFERLRSAGAYDQGYAASISDRYFPDRYFPERDFPER